MLDSKYRPSFRLSRWQSRAALVALSLAASLLATALYAQLGPPPEPPGNPVTLSKARLGKVLFWDEQLSSPRTVACASCHILSAGGSDPRSLTSPLAVNPGPDALFGTDDDVLGSPGVPLSDSDGLYHWSELFGLTEQATGRRAPAAINAGYSPELFWDGRAANEFRDPITNQVVLPSGAALESQAVGPPVSNAEMAHVGRDWTDIEARLTASTPLALATQVPLELSTWIAGRTYPELFEEAFGTAQVTASGAAMAIATYERTLLANQTPYDDFLANVPGALTAQELAGLDVFNQNHCSVCHPSAILSDHDFHYLGLRPAGEDVGRFAVTLDPNDIGKVRTPSLRNLELRAPYMRNGRMATIREVIQFYNRGGDFDAPNKSPFIHPLSLTPQQRLALEAFLTRPLTDPRVAAELPPFDRPLLYTESDRVPVVEGTGAPGPGGFVPKVVAIEPPLLGNPSFTVGVYEALGGAQALLVIDDVDPGLSPPASADFAFETITLSGSGAGNGYGSVSLAIPNDLALLNNEWFGRWYVTATNNGDADAVSQVFRFTVFPAYIGGMIFADGFESSDTAAWSATVP